MLAVAVLGTAGTGVGALARAARRTSWCRKRRVAHPAGQGRVTSGGVDGVNR